MFKVIIQSLLWSPLKKGCPKNLNGGGGGGGGSAGSQFSQCDMTACMHFPYQIKLGTQGNSEDYPLKKNIQETTRNMSKILEFLGMVLEVFLTVGWMLNRKTYSAFKIT